MSLFLLLQRKFMKHLYAVTAAIMIRQLLLLIILLALIVKTGQISSSRGSLARKMCMLCQNIGSLQLMNDSNIIWAIGTIKQIGN